MELYQIPILVRVVVVVGMEMHSAMSCHLSSLVTFAALVEEADFWEAYHGSPTRPPTPPESDCKLHSTFHLVLRKCYVCSEVGVSKAKLN